MSGQTCLSEGWQREIGVDKADIRGQQGREDAKTGLESTVTKETSDCSKNAFVINSVTHPLVSHSFTAPPRPNGQR